MSQLGEVQYERQLRLPVLYKGKQIECGYRVDFMVESSVVIELKAVTRMSPIFEAQLLTYVKLLGA